MKEGDRRPSVIRKTDNAEYTNELLVQFLIDNDCTNIDTALLEEMKNKANVLKEHPYKISEQEKHGETYYITYVKDETKRNKRRQISAKTKAVIRQIKCGLIPQIKNDFLRYAEAL